MVQTDTVRAIMLSPSSPSLFLHWRPQEPHKYGTSASRRCRYHLTARLEATRSSPAAGVGRSRRGRSHPLCCEVPLCCESFPLRRVNALSSPLVRSKEDRASIGSWAEPLVPSRQG